MEGELRELYLNPVVFFEFLDTPGDEIAPRSNEIGKYFKDERLGHGRPPACSNGSGSARAENGMMMQTVCSHRDTTAVLAPKSKSAIDTGPS
jgi:hypothetical protein